MNNIVFLGLNRSYSLKALKRLKKMNCKVVAEHTEKFKFTNFPVEYDLGISFGYLHKIPIEEIKKCPWINFHPAPLPDYGGRNVAYHAILNKETSFGATIHHVSENFDEGDIIESKKFDFSLGTTAKELYTLACETSLDLFDKYVPKFLQNQTVVSYKQKNRTYYKKQNISDFINLEDDVKRKITALYYPPHYPKIKIGHKTFIIKEDT